MEARIRDTEARNAADRVANPAPAYPRDFGIFIKILTGSQKSDERMAMASELRHKNFKLIRRRRVRQAGGALNNRFRIFDFRKANPFFRFCQENYKNQNSGLLLEFFESQSQYFRLMLPLERHPLEIDVSTVLNKTDIERLLAANSQVQRRFRGRNQIEEILTRDSGHRENLAGQIKHVYSTTSLPVTKICEYFKIPRFKFYRLRKASFDPAALLPPRQKYCVLGQGHDLRLDEFRIFFGKAKTSCRTAMELSRRWAANNGWAKPEPLTTFRRRWLRPLGIRFKMRKHEGIRESSQVLREKRFYFLLVFRDLALQGADFVFYDESTFEVRRKNQRSYSERGVRPTFVSTLQPVVIKLSLICDFQGVICHQIDDSSSTGKSVSTFIKEFVLRHRSMNKNRSRRLVMVLDNSSKNRVESIKNLANFGYVRLLYTVPTSPFLNFVENIFLVLKRHVYARPDSERLGS